MAVEIPDLWDEDIKVDVLSPVLILRKQGDLITRKTSGVLEAEVNSVYEAVGDGQVMQLTHSLRITASVIGGRL